MQFTASTIFQLLYHARAHDKDIVEINRIEDRYYRGYNTPDTIIKIVFATDKPVLERWAAEMQSTQIVLSQERWVQKHQDEYSTQPRFITLSQHALLVSESSQYSQGPQKNKGGRKRQAGTARLTDNPATATSTNATITQAPTPPCPGIGGCPPYMPCALQFISRVLRQKFVNNIRFAYTLKSDDFRSYTMRNFSTEDSLTIRHIPKAFARLMKQMSREQDELIDATDFARLVQKLPADGEELEGRHDLCYFVSWLLDVLVEGTPSRESQPKGMHPDFVKKETNGSPITEALGTQIQSTLRCNDCSTETQVSDRRPVLKLVRGSSALLGQDVILPPSEISWQSGAARECACGGHMSTKEQVVMRCPNDLILDVGSLFDSDSAGPQDATQYPKVVDLASAYPSVAQHNKGTTYELRAVVSRQDADYVLHIQIRDKWFLCNNGTIAVAASSSLVSGIQNRIFSLLIETASEARDAVVHRTRDLRGRHTIDSSSEVQVFWYTCLFSRFGGRGTGKYIR
jgi:hypothetical protein